MHLTRFSDWSERLSVYLDRVRDEPFEWGRHDCVLFVSGAVKAITGHDFVEGISGQYSTKLEAAQWLRNHGHGTLVGAVCSALDLPVHVAHAGRGDVVRRGKALGICAGRFSWFVGEEPRFIDLANDKITYRRGLVAWPTLACDDAWKVAPVGPEAA